MMKDGGYLIPPEMGQSISYWNEIHSGTIDYERDILPKIKALLPFYWRPFWKVYLRWFPTKFIALRNKVYTDLLVSRVSVEYWRELLHESRKVE